MLRVLRFFLGDKLVPKITSREGNRITDEPPLYYSVAALAEMLGVHRRTVHKRIVGGRIRAIQIGDVYGIPRAEAARLKKEKLAA